MKKAVLFGATGFVGSHLLIELLNSAEYEQVTIVVRRSMPVTHVKLKVVIADYRTLPALADQIDADEIFISLGTTKAQTPDQKAYYELDHDYPVLAAKLAKERGARAVFIVTAVGANASSGIFYVRTRGEVEKDIIALGFEHTHIFRPSMIMGDRKEQRTMEKTFIRLSSVINPLLLGKLSKFKGIDGATIARAMVAAAAHPAQKTNTYHWNEMQRLLAAR